MKTTQRAWATTAITCSLALAGSAMAQMPMDQSKMSMTAVSAAAASPGMTDGEIRKIDKENAKITIKHGEIKSLDMPPMSMVFNVKEKAMLDKVQVGQKIQFVVVMDAGKMVVTDMQPGK